METVKIVTELYSLRAGLSLLAQETDKYECEVKAAETRKMKELNQAKAVKDREIQQSATRLLPEYSEYKKGYAPNDELKTYWDEYRKAEQASEKAKEARFAAWRRMEDAVSEAKAHASNRKDDKPFLILTLAFGILFLTLHLVLAGLSYYNIFLLNYNGFIFLLNFAISLGIGITELVWVHNIYCSIYDYDGFNCNSKRECVRDGFMRFFAWIFYALNIVSYFSFMIIGFIGAYADVNTTAIITVIAVSTCLCAIITTIMIFSNYKWYHHSKPKSTQSEEDEYARLDAEYNRLKAESEKRQKIYENEYKKTKRARDSEHVSITLTAEEEYEEKCEKINAQYKETCTASIKVYTTICKPIWNTLVQTYGELLDARDWEILDLIIWQLETHRAETLKEALQLADREVQTDRIVGALHFASEAIGNQIRMGLGSLQSQLNYNFNALASGFASAAHQISNKIDALSGSFENSVYDLSSKLDESMQNMRANQITTNKSLEQICSQSSLQTALLEKAGTSSSNLLEAVNKLRETKFKEANR